MGIWKYIDSIVELSDFESAHCNTRDFCMVVYDTIDEPWEVLINFLKKNQAVVEQCSFNKDEIIPLLKSLETASGGVEAVGIGDHWWIKYIRFQRLSNGQYFCFTDSADTIIPLYKDKLKAEFVNQDENHKVHGR
jgi:hypothetical protein